MENNNQNKSSNNQNSSQPSNINTPNNQFSNNNKTETTTNTNANLSNDKKPNFQSSKINSNTTNTNNNTFNKKSDNQSSNLNQNIKNTSNSTILNNVNNKNDTKSNVNPASNKDANLFDNKNSNTQQSNINTLNKTIKEKKWWKKRWYIILPIAAAAITTVIAVPCTITCSNKSGKGNVELSDDVSKLGVSIKESNIIKGHESTLLLGLPDGKEISSIVITIGDKTLTMPDVKVSGGKITISADKMTDNKVIIKTLTLKYIVPVEEVKLDKTTLSLKADTATLTVTVLPENATNKNVTWKSSNENIAIVDQNGKITAKAIGETDISVTSIDGSKTATCKVTVTALNFTTCSWNHINTYSTKLEQGEITTSDFCSFFTKDGKNEITTMADFIGLKRTITINNQNHVIRVIGTQHDSLVESGTTTTKKAALTFETVTLLSENNGSYVLTNWALINNKYYKNSSLRAALTGQGEGSSSLNVLSLLPNELKSIVRNVTKEVAMGDSFTTTNYNDKLFPLTYTEIGLSGDTYAKVEGSIYEYWKNHNTSNDRAKRTTKGYAYSYWLASPSTENLEQKVYYISDMGYCKNEHVSNNCAIDFAFCI